MKGLPNLGNTCYFNTAVQCLAHVPLLANTLLRTGYDGPCELTREFSKLVGQIWSDGIPDPRALHCAFTTRFPQFAGTGQHDAQEVIICLIDIFENSLNKKFIKKIFTGREEQETVYPGGKSVRTDDFVSVLFPMVGDTGEVTLEELMRRRAKHAALSGYVDDKGRTHNVAAVCQRVTEWPIVATFTFGMYGPKSIVTLPEIFEGRRLFAVVLHAGMMHGGHYAVAVRHGDKWLLKDDDSVSELKEAPLKGPFYMAMYRLQTQSAEYSRAGLPKSGSKSDDYLNTSYRSVSSPQTIPARRTRTRVSSRPEPPPGYSDGAQPLCTRSLGPAQTARARCVRENRSLSVRAASI